LVIGIAQSLKLAIGRLDLNDLNLTTAPSPMIRHEMVAYEVSRCRHEREIVRIHLTRLRSQVLLVLASRRSLLQALFFHLLDYRVTSAQEFFGVPQSNI
jgi:hypothetical protein